MSRENALWIGGVSFSKQNKKYCSWNKKKISFDLTEILQDSQYFYDFFSNFCFIIIFFLQLEKYMTEEFLKEAFRLMGEDSVESVKIIKNKFTGVQAAYGFIHFDSDAAALMAIHKLNNKMIPHSQPVSFFSNL